MEFQDGTKAIGKRQADILVRLVDAMKSEKIRVSFIGNDIDSMKYGKDIKTGAVRTGNSVDLYLVEPENEEDLELWHQALLKAKKHLDEISHELYHELSSPNFFRAAKVRCMFHKWFD